MESTAILRKAAGYVLAAIIGILMGIITLIGQKYLPDNLNFLSNSASVWVVPAFLVPYCLRCGKRRSTLLSMVILIFCVLSYYVFEALYNHHSYFINRYQLLWLCCAVTGGVIIGLSSNLSRVKEGIIGNVCKNILPAIFVTEASSKLLHVNDYRHMLPGLFLQMSIGIALYVVINRKNALKKENVFSVFILLILGNTAFDVLWRLGY